MTSNSPVEGKENSDRPGTGGAGPLLGTQTQGGRPRSGESWLGNRVSCSMVFTQSRCQVAEGSHIFQGALGVDECIKGEVVSTCEADQEVSAFFRVLFPKPGHFISNPMPFWCAITVSYGWPRTYGLRTCTFMSYPLWSH